MKAFIGVVCLVVTREFLHFGKKNAAILQLYEKGIETRFKKGKKFGPTMANTTRDTLKSNKNSLML